MKTIDHYSKYQLAVEFITQHSDLSKKELLRYLKYVIELPPRTASFYLSKIRKDLGLTASHDAQ